MSISTKELREKRGSIAKQMHEIVTTAAAESRAFTADEQTKFDRLESDERQLRDTIDRMDRVQPLEEEVSAARQEAAARRDFDAKKRDLPTAADYRDAFRAWALGRNAPDNLRNAAKKCGIDPTFERLTLTPGITRASTAATHAGSTATGGDAVVAEPLGALMETVKSYGGIRQVATVIRTQSGSAMDFPVLDDTSAVAVIVGESTARDTQSPVFGNKQIATFTYSSQFVKASLEFVQDVGFDFGTWLGNALGTRIGRGTNNHFTVGTGSGQPFGAVTDALRGIIATSGTATISTTNLIRLVHSVDPAWRARGAAFMMNDHSLRTVKALVDSQGRPLWLPGIAQGEPDTLLGYPYVINNDMATDTTATGSVKVVAFGYWPAYYVRDVMSINLQRTDERFIDNGQVAWIAHSRHGGRTVASDATTTLWPILTLQTGTT